MQTTYIEQNIPLPLGLIKNFDDNYYVEDFDTELPVEEKKLLLKALA